MSSNDRFSFQVRLRRRLVRTGVLAPVQRLRLESTQLLGRVDVRAGRRWLRVRLSGGSGRQTLRQGRAAVGRQVFGQTFVPVCVHGRTRHAPVQRRARNQTVRRTRRRVLRQTRRGQQVFVSLAVRRRIGVEDFRSRYASTAGG